MKLYSGYINTDKGTFTITAHATTTFTSIHEHKDDIECNFSAPIGYNEFSHYINYNKLNKLIQVKDNIYVYYSEDYTNVEETLTEFRKDLIRSLHNKLHNCGRSEYNTIYEQLENMNNSKIIFTDSTIGQLV